MPAIVSTFVDAVVRVVREIDAAFATGSISNARAGVHESTRRRALQGAAGRGIPELADRREAV
jgi:hypothetical protein